MKHLGVTATRQGLQLLQLKTCIALLRASLDLETFHHGDCIGGDADLHLLCRKVFKERVHIRGHPPVDQSQRAFLACDSFADPLPYIKRNHIIVNIAELMIACPSGYTDIPRGSGTWATIRYAMARKPLLIVWPDGRVKSYNHVFPYVEKLNLQLVRAE